MLFRNLNTKFISTMNDIKKNLYMVKIGYHKYTLSYLLGLNLANSFRDWLQGRILFSTRINRINKLLYKIIKYVNECFLEI